MAVRERLGEAIFRVTAGPDGPRHRARIHGRPGPRWFDGASPIGGVHGDASMFIGGMRALLLQTLHPAAMAGVAEHSDYRIDMLGRLARTSRFLAVTTFGHADDAQRAVDAVRAIHERMTGTLPDGTPYDATDPHLLGWVHVAEVDSFLRPTRSTAGGRWMPPAGTSTSRRPPWSPAGSASPTRRRPRRSSRRLEAYRPELAATDHAREAVRHVVHKPPMRWPPARRTACWWPLRSA